MQYLVESKPVSDPFETTASETPESETSSSAAPASTVSSSTKQPSVSVKPQDQTDSESLDQVSTDEEVEQSEHTKDCQEYIHPESARSKNKTHRHEKAKKTSTKARSTGAQSIRTQQKGKDLPARTPFLQDFIPPSEEARKLRSERPVKSKYDEPEQEAGDSDPDDNAVEAEEPATLWYIYLNSNVKELQVAYDCMRRVKQSYHFDHLLNDNKMALLDSNACVESSVSTKARPSRQHLLTGNDFQNIRRR